MSKFVTLVYGEDIDKPYIIAVYLNTDDADYDYPWNYKEVKYLNLKPRTQTPEKDIDEAVHTLQGNKRAI